MKEKLSAMEPSCMLHPHIATTFSQNKRKVMDSGDVEVLYDNTSHVEENFASQAITKVKAENFIKNKELHEEVFGPFSVVVECKDKAELLEVLSQLNGQLTGTIMGTDREIEQYMDAVEILKERVGRLVFNSVPTGVEVCQAMFHGGPYPASTDSRFTAVGNDAIKRWVRPVSYQDWPEQLLPPELNNENTLNIWRIVDGERTRN